MPGGGSYGIVSPCYGTYGPSAVLDAFHGRKTKLAPEHPHSIASLREFVGLYESVDKPDEAAAWRARRPGEADAGP